LVPEGRDEPKEVKQEFAAKDSADASEGWLAKG
jgi:hypothetical protein